MIEEFVSRMFALRDASHVAHWAAKGDGSFSAHMALGEFYEALVEKTDEIVEVYQGFFGLIKPVNPLPYNRDKIMEQIQSEAKWLSNNCEEICQGNGAIENLLYDMQALMARTYYKLKNLK